MTKRYIALLTFAALAMTSQAALLTLSNADFETDDADTPVVSNWDEYLGTGSGTLERYSVQANPTTSSKVAQAQARGGNILQQAFLVGEAVAGGYASFTVEFDYGWRNENTTTDMNIQVALINLTDTTDVNAPVIISSQTVDLGLGTVTATDTWRTLAIDHQVSLTDSSLAGDAGDTIGLAFIVDTTANSFSPSAWIDNVTVTSIPEPATLGMVAVFGGGILFIRRKLML